MGPILQNLNFKFFEKIKKKNKKKNGEGFFCPVGTCLRAYKGPLGA